jgi:hypothetical protein
MIQMDWSSVAALATAIFTGGLVWVSIRQARIAHEQAKIAQEQTEVSKALARLQEKLAEAERMGLIHLEAQKRVEVVESPPGWFRGYEKLSLSLTNLGKYGCLIYRTAILSSEEPDEKGDYPVAVLLLKEAALVPGERRSWDFQRASLESELSKNPFIMVEFLHVGNPWVLERFFFKVEFDQEGSPSTTFLKRESYLS